MYKISNKKKVAAVLGAGALALSGGGVAFAYWSSTGTGSGNAATGTTANVTVVQTTSTSTIYPGGSVPLAGKFNNANSGSVHVGAVTATLGTLPSGCLAADFTITGTATVNAEIPAGSNVGAWTGLSLNMADTAISQDGCKNQTIPVNYSVS